MRVTLKCPKCGSEIVLLTIENNKCTTCGYTSETLNEWWHEEAED